MSFFHVEGKSLLKPILIGAASGFLIMLILLALFAFVIRMMPGVPYQALDYITLGIEGVSVLSGAYFAGVIAKSRGLIIGAICGCLTLLVLFSCGLSVSGNDIGWLTPVKCAVILLCSIVGGIAGVNRKEKLHIK